MATTNEMHRLEAERLERENTPKGYAHTTKSGKIFDDRRGAAKGSGQKIPTYEGFYLRPHDMSSLKDSEIQALIERTLQEGRVLSDDEILGITGKHISTDVYNKNKIAYYHTILDDNANMFGFDSTGAAYIPTEDEQLSAQEDAFNKYYNDVYSLEEGTTGYNMYQNLADAERRAAVSNMQLADAQLQSAAMQQATTVKNITDQVRAERMARLRAGMSEAQIANQDMQSMMTNINALNQQTNEMNLARLQAQQQYELAQDTAYQQYLTQTNTMGQTAAAMAASDAGDAMSQAKAYARATGVTLPQAYRMVTAQNKN